jgi:hypothetical protein
VGIVFTALFLGVGVAAIRGDRARVVRYGKIGAALLLAYAAMFSQLKLFLYHFETLLLPVALLGAVLYEELYEAAASPLARSEVPPAFAAATLASFFLSGFAKDAYLLAFQNVSTHLLKGTSELDFVTSFEDEGLQLGASKQAGDWIATHSKPTDALLVRGYECQIYFYAHRHDTGRFEHSLFQTHPWLAWRRDYYLAEDYRDIVTRRPRFVVAMRESVYPIEKSDWFVARGYVKRAGFGRFDILELVDEASLVAGAAN